jgi:RND family efflux transporter MFP subunit
MGWLIVIASGCHDSAARPAPDNSPTSADSATAQVSVAAAEVIPWPRTVHVQGSLMSDERVVVGAKVAGRIAALGEDSNHKPIDLGAEVRAGDVLARLEAEEFQLKVQQAESQVQQVCAALGLKPTDDDSKLDPTKAPTVVQEKALLDEAQGNWERAESLNRQKAISAEELQQRKAQFDVAAARYESALHGVDESIALLKMRRAELALAQQMLQDTETRAPFEGVVEERFVAPGAFVQVGEPVVTLVKMKPWRFRASVPEREAAALRTGQAVSIHIEGDQRRLDAVIIRHSPSLDMSTRSLVIEAVQRPDAAESSTAAEAASSEPVVRHGQFAEADIVVDANARALAVPQSAVREFAGVEKVWLVVRGEAVEKPVVIGRRQPDRVEVLDGLAEGDLVVVENAPKQAGPVQIVPSP